MGLGRAVSYWFSSPFPSPYGITRMFIQYNSTTEIPSLINAGLNKDGLAVSGQWTKTGAPTATADFYIPGAFLQNTVDATLYTNTGTSASPVWTLVGGGGGIVMIKQ